MMLFKATSPNKYTAAMINEPLPPTLVEWRFRANPFFGAALKTGLCVVKCGGLQH